MRTKQELLARMDALGACDEATEYVSAHASDSAEQIWNDCPRADWLLWLAARVAADRKAVVRAACACARTALRFVPEGELRPLKAIEAAEAWTRGVATIAEVRTAARHADDAYSYSYAAADAAAAYAAYSYAPAADYAAASAAYAAASYFTREKALAELAVLVRTHISFSMIQEASK